MMREMTVSSGKMVFRKVTKVLGMSGRTDFSSMVPGMVHGGLGCCLLCCMLPEVCRRADE